MSFSRAWGLLFHSELETGLPPAEAGEPDVEIRLGELAPRPDDRFTWWRVERDEVTFWSDGFATFCVRGGREIVVQPDPNAALEDVALVLRAFPLATLLMQRGLIVLHASAVQAPSGVVLVVGRKGCGKSTWAAALQARGYPVLSDDTAVLRVHKDGVELLPGSPELKLSTASLMHLGKDPRRCFPIRPGFQKFHVWLGSGGSGPAQVRSIFFLRLIESLERELVSVDQRVALQMLYSAVYGARILAAMSRPRRNLSETLRNLARNTPAFSVSCPQSLEHLEEGVSALVSELERLPTSRAHWSQQARLPNADLLNVSDRRPASTGFVALASFPKSGNTWVRALLTAWREQTRLETNVSELDGGAGVLDAHTFAEELALNHDHLRLVEELPRWRARFNRLRAARLRSPVIVKLHEDCFRTPDEEPVFPPDALVGVVYIVRCPLDVVPSHANHYSLSIDEAIESLGSRSWMNLPSRGSGGERLPHPIGSWSEHVASWLDEPLNRCLLVRYEDLLQDTLGELKRILDFIDQPRIEKDDLDFVWDEDRARRAVELCRFEKLKAREEEGGFRERLRGAEVFFRKGQSGSWRETLTSEQARKICTRHGPMMRRLGYAAEVDEVMI